MRVRWLIIVILFLTFWLVSYQFCVSIHFQCLNRLWCVEIENQLNHWKGTELVDSYNYVCWAEIIRYLWRDIRHCSARYTAYYGVLISHCLVPWNSCEQSYGSVCWYLEFQIGIPILTEPFDRSEFVDDVRYYSVRRLLCGSVRA